MKNLKYLPSCKILYVSERCVKTSIEMRDIKRLCKGFAILP